MRIVLDSNVIVAAFATHGICYDIFEYCLRSSTIVCREFIINEVERILIKKIKLPIAKTSQIVHFLKEHAYLVNPAPSKVENLRDLNDNMIIATALTAQADYVITGDKDLLVLKRVHKINIITPREFWLNCQ